MRALRAAAAFGAVAMALAALDRACPPDVSRYRASLELRDASGEVLNTVLTPDGKRRLLTRAQDVDPAYLAALLRTEDRRFAWHPGIDPLALARAAAQYAGAGHIVSGGSTLAMQTARLLMPHRRDVPGKLLEIVRALQLQARYGRDGVLGMYLTLAPFGGNIEGVRAASLTYFGMEPRRLEPERIALLVALPQSPTRLRPDRHAQSAEAARDKIMARLGMPASDAPVPAVRLALPAIAPYVADRFGAAAGPVTTTLDGRLQRAAEELVAREKPWLGERGSVAALVVRNRDRAILAYVGGDRAGPGGMVDMVRAPRSPGSTLKPFVYGIAMDDALIRPDTLIDDTRLRIGDYAPRNFDRDIHGTITAAEALRQSYNLPAVALLDAIGPARFVAALRQTGATVALPPGAAPALPVVLGGAGVTLEDLASLYCGLANGGQVARVRLLASDAAFPVPLMTRESARAVSGILRDAPLPAGLASGRARGIAYKTGTSYGFRDALAAGWSAEYTVAVWVGRVEGSARPGMFGRIAAAPLMEKLFDLLPPEPEPPPLPPAITPVIAPGLRHFAPGGGFVTGTPRPRILYPPANATIDAGEPGGAVALEAAGGSPPYRWAVDGVPLPPGAPGVAAAWHPNGDGFSRVTVIDRAGGFASEDVRVVR